MPRAGTLPIVLTGVFVTILDFFIVNVAVPTMQRDLHASSTAIEWVVAGYSLAYGAGLILGGRLGDIHGRRRLFTLGLTLFTLASLGCGIAPSSTTLVIARVVQGASAALLAPQVLAILRTAYTGRAQLRAINAYALTMGLAAVFGQLIGGLLIQADLFGLDWRACFLINLPIGAVALALSRRMIPESRVPSATRLDLGGTALVTLALTAILLPLIEGREQGWPLWTWLSFALAVVLLIGYGRRRHPSPLIDLTMFRERAFSAGLLTHLAFTMSLAAYFLIFALYTQQGRHLDALHAGLAFVPIGAGYLVASLLAPRLTARLGRQLVAVGALIRAAALVALLILVGDGGSIWRLVPALAIDGVGIGFVLGPIMTTVLARVAPRHAGGAAGALTTIQQLGGAVGIGLVSIVFYGRIATGLPHAFQAGLVYLIAVSIVVAALVQFMPRTTGRAVTLRQSAIQAPQEQEFVS